MSAQAISPAASPAGPPSEAPPSAKASISISEGAAAYAKRKLAARGTPDAAIRVGIKGGGCSGYSYVIEFDDEKPRERDHVYEKDGVTFYVDRKSLVYLAGSVLDYERSMMQEGYKFRNPNEASSCGCGHSFTVK